jgi:hypothetical protein
MPLLIALCNVFVALLIRQKGMLCCFTLPTAALMTPDIHEAAASSVL